MSYILDALKKSDQQRQHGATPTLTSVQFPTQEAGNRGQLWLAGVALVLIVAGVLIGLWRPWQAAPQRPPAPAEQVVSRPPPASPSAAAAPPAPPTVARRPPEPSAALNLAPPPMPGASVPAAAVAPAPVVLRTPSAPAMPAAAAERAPATSVKPAPAAAPEPPPLAAKPAVAEPSAVVEQKVATKAELPAAIQQEIPKMAVSLHAYSGKPKNRLVSVNDQLLHEGDALAPGLILEQITPEDMVFSYKGFRFRQGVH